ncbi:MAG TPA: hypothetical protein VGL58_14725 [Caulobacteraceae bacterium]|jgi:hypothetical protein
MTDDAAQLARQSAYLDGIRALGRRTRLAGFVLSALGVLMVIAARYRVDSPQLLWGGVAVVAAGWGCFIYAVARRITWVRAHPFDPNG